MCSALADLLRALCDRMSGGPPAIGGEEWDRLLAARADLVVSLEVIGHGGLAQRIDRKFSRFRRALAQGRGGATGDGRAAFALDDSLAELRHLVEATERRLGAAGAPRNTARSKAGGEGFTPTPAMANILEALAKARTTLIQVDIQHASGQPLRVVKDLLRQLEERGHVDRPHGERKGYAITAKGRELLNRRCEPER